MWRGRAGDHFFLRKLLPPADKACHALADDYFPDAMIPITERFLSDCGGWQALRDARGIHAAGRVRAVTYAPPLLEGRVREGAGELKSGLRITSPSHVENLCTCRASQRDGMICAHALAVGLEWLKPTAAPAPAVAAVAFTAPQDAEPDFRMDEREPADPPRFALALEGSLNHLTARLDALYGEHRFTVESAPQRTGKTPRHHAAERQALARLHASGFAGPDRTGQLVLKGEPAILAFFARDLPRLEKEWTVTIGSRFAHVTSNIERIQPRLEIRTSGENWFDLQYELATPGGDRFSAAEIQRLLQSGQSATRLKNRKLAVFDPGLIEEFREALTDCNPDQRQPGLYRFARCHAPFLGEMAKEQGAQVRADAAWQQWQAPSASLPDAGPSPAALSAFDSILRPYQKEGVHWLNTLFHRGLNGILADEMGLGKTVQTLAWLSGLGTGKALVVCPSSLIFNWEREARRFTPDRRTLAIQGADRHALFGEPLGTADLVITSYALLRRDIDRYRQTDFAAVVLDEAQHIKNPDSQNAQSAFALKAKRRLVLTGTPVENSLADLWSLTHFLMPGYLGTRQDFRERFQQPIESAPGGPVHRRLIKRLQPCILRRLKKNVLTELPDKIEHVAYCELTEEQREIYTKLADATRRQTQELAGAKDQAKARMLMLTALLRLRQTCCDLRLLNLEGPPASLREPSGKLQMLEELLNEAIDGGHRVLIFSQFTSMLALMRETLAQMEIAPCYLDGKTKDRAAEVDRFESGQAQVFLISLKAGGTGLNLTSADTVIHFDPWWNPAVENQATDRAHRIGQKKVVTAYKLISRNTVEEKILALQTRKQGLIDATLDHEQPLMEGLTTDDIREILA